MILKDIGFKEKIALFRRLLDQADAILVGAGSGLSVDAGLDYFDPHSFAENYPAMVPYGFSTNVELMGLDQLSCPGLFWGYYLTHGNHMRFCNSVQPVYRRLLDLVLGKDYFVITTNVDSLFIRNGFAKDSIYTPQGDYGRIQCKKPCSDQTWPSEPVINGLLPLVDPLTGKLPQDFVPTCPNCGGQVFYNVRGDSSFVDTPYEDQHAVFMDWIQKNKERRLLLIDIGTGFHTPVWIRWPFEKITSENPGSHLIRINRDDPHVPENITARSISFPDRAVKVIDAVSLKTNMGHLNSQDAPQGDKHGFK